MSPIIYRYFKITLEFYSRESVREGWHVHVIANDDKRGVKVLFDPNDFSMKWVADKKRKPLDANEMKLALEIVPKYKGEIIKKYVDFRLGKKIKPVTITRRIK